MSVLHAGTNGAQMSSKIFNPYFWVQAFSDKSIDPGNLPGFVPKKLFIE